MTGTHRRLAAAAVLACTVAAVAAPAGAETVDVSLGVLGGTRQFAVEDLSGNPLKTISLGTGGTQPFRTRVVDSSFTSISQPYTVGATMSNLYLKDGAGYDWATKVPSSQLSFIYPTNPLSALGVAFPVIPSLSLSGTLPTCAGLPSSVKTALGLSVTGVTSDLAVAAVCTALGTGLTVPDTTTLDGVVRQVTAAATNLLDIPTQLTGATTGTFDSADYAEGTIGFGDPNKPNDNDPTSLQVMRGTPNLTDALRAEITSRLTSALSTMPLTAVGDDGAEATVASVVTALSSSADQAVAQLGTALSTLDAVKQSAVVNLLTSAVLPSEMDDIKSLSGQYFAFPSLKAQPVDLVPGEYAGTMTVTFVQQ